MEWAGPIGAIGAALISGVFAVLITRLRRESTEQHAVNQTQLEAIGDDVGEVKTDVREVRSSQIRHLEWHAEK
jgi:uncharacterized membrane-anchored protein YhcB (DUF1043 family)|tara:strand:- start:1606 stop:1824 length:219 start_codon:yes stop_codon:yes gene_type:complete